MTSPDAAVAARPGTGLRDQLLDAAIDVICDESWSAVTMARLGAAAGVSRQTVYNELGSKDRLAEALVVREFRAFLEVVDEQLCAGVAPVDSVRRASAAVLGLAATSPLLRAVIESAHGSNSELLPLLTTDSQPLIRAATAMIELRLAGLYPDQLPGDDELAEAVDAIVRVILSHVLAPEPAGPDGRQETLERVVWVARRLLRLSD